jgi:predicted dehydrogenase
VAFVTLVYESGIVANVELSWLAPSKLRRTVIVGSQKMVVYDDGAAEPVRIFDHGVVYRDPETFGQYHLSYRTGDILSPNIAIREPLVEELDDFVSAIRFGHEPESTPNLARQVVELAEAADESLHRGGAEIEVGRAGRFSAAGSEYGRLATRVGS